MSLFLILFCSKVLLLFILFPFTIKKFSASVYFGYFSYNIDSSFINFSVFFVVIGKSISCSPEINLIEINFSPSEKLQYFLNNFISFSNSIILLFCELLFDIFFNSFIFLFKFSFFIFSSFIIKSFSFIFDSNSFIFFSNSFILFIYSLS